MTKFKKKKEIEVLESASFEIISKMYETEYVFRNNIISLNRKEFCNELQSLPESASRMACGQIA